MTPNLKGHTQLCALTHTPEYTEEVSVEVAASRDVMVEVAGGRKVCVLVVYVYPSLPHCHQHDTSLHYQELVVFAPSATAHQALVATAERCSAERC